MSAAIFFLSLTMSTRISSEARVSDIMLFGQGGFARHATGAAVRASRTAANRFLMLTLRIRLFLTGSE